jgi:succinate dehydrogenase/fumarate reductase flavoprotein subunit
MYKNVATAAVVVAIATVVVRFASFAPMAAGDPPPAPARYQVVVIGSGLAGHSAALSAAEECTECSVLLLEKEPRVGGNSLKASSGINAVAAAGQGDSAERFKDDILRSGGGLSEPALVDALVRDSQGALAWLAAAGVDLSGTVQLGGHTSRRTHFPPRGPVGFSIVSALAKKVEAHPNITVLAGATV